MDEIWLDIIEYEGIYQISNLGRVKSLNYKKERILKYGKRKDDYLYVNLCKNGNVKKYYVHRLVITHFILNLENKPCVNHKNGIKTDNKIENLEWVSFSDNNKHAFMIGLRNNKGENHSGAKLTKENVIVIKQLLKQNIPPRKIAKQFDVHWNTIYNIKYRKTWAHTI